MKINIDAAHGSNTAGKRTPDGYREHYISVKAAVALGRALIRCGFEIMRTGYNDSNAYDDPDVSITSRQKAVKNGKCNASVSLHANAYGNGKTYNTAEGASVHIHSLESKWNDSARLARMIQDEIVKGTPQKNRGVKTGNFGMCNAVYMNVDAAVLVEIGFMTNEREASLMADGTAFCEEQAEDICRALCKYYNVTYVPKTTPTITPVESTQKPVYVVGKTYTLQVELKVRTGPGTNYPAKKHDQLTDSGKKHDADGDGALDKGTVITCKEVKENGSDIWIHCPSGWVAAYYHGNTYIK